MRYGLGLLVFWLALSAFAEGPVAAGPVFNFDTPAQEARFQQLTQELRCLVCQNQSLADSHADLAGDLRREVYEMLRAGKTNEEIIDFMVSRYGNFVRFRPPVDAKTYALWFGPVLLLLAGGLLLARALKGRSQAPALILSPEEQRRVEALLEEREP
jgi:cytochrome c-type biogenesis protein CcmH